MTCDCSLLESLFTTMIRRLIVYPKKKRPKSAAASSLQKFWISWQLDNRVYDKPFLCFWLTIIKKEIWNERERMKFYNFSWVRYIYHFIIQFWVTDDMQNADCWSFEKYWCKRIWKHQRKLKKCFRTFFCNILNNCSNFLVKIMHDRIWQNSEIRNFIGVCNCAVVKASLCHAKEFREINLSYGSIQYY